MAMNPNQPQSSRDCFERQELQSLWAKNNSSFHLLLIFLLLHKIFPSIACEVDVPIFIGFFVLSSKALTTDVNARHLASNSDYYTSEFLAWKRGEREFPMGGSGSENDIKSDKQATEQRGDMREDQSKPEEKSGIGTQSGNSAEMLARKAENFDTVFQEIIKENSIKFDEYRSAMHTIFGKGNTKGTDTGNSATDDSSEDTSSPTKSEPTVATRTEESSVSPSASPVSNSSEEPPTSRDSLPVVESRPKGVSKRKQTLNVRTDSPPQSPPESTLTLVYHDSEDDASAYVFSKSTASNSKTAETKDKNPGKLPPFHTVKKRKHPGEVFVEIINADGSKGYAIADDSGPGPAKKSNRGRESQSQEASDQKKTKQRLKPLREVIEETEKILVSLSNSMPLNPSPIETNPPNTEQTRQETANSPQTNVGDVPRVNQALQTSNYTDATLSVTPPQPRLVLLNQDSVSSDNLNRPEVPQTPVPRPPMVPASPNYLQSLEFMKPKSFPTTTIHHRPTSPIQSTPKQIQSPSIRHQGSNVVIQKGGVQSKLPVIDNVVVTPSPNFQTPISHPIITGGSKLITPGQSFPVTQRPQLNTNAMRNVYVRQIVPNTTGTTTGVRSPYTQLKQQIPSNPNHSGIKSVVPPPNTKQGPPNATGTGMQYLVSRLNTQPIPPNATRTQARRSSTRPTYVYRIQPSVSDTGNGSLMQPQFFHQRPSNTTGSGMGSITQPQYLRQVQQSSKSITPSVRPQFVRQRLPNANGTRVTARFQTGFPRTGIKFRQRREMPLLRLDKLADSQYQTSNGTDSTRNFSDVNSNNRVQLMPRLPEIISQKLFKQRQELIQGPQELVLPIQEYIKPTIKTILQRQKTTQQPRDFYKEPQEITGLYPEYTQQPQETTPQGLEYTQQTQEYMQEPQETPLQGPEYSQQPQETTQQVREYIQESQETPLQGPEYSQLPLGTAQQAQEYIQEFQETTPQGPKYSQQPLETVQQAREYIQEPQETTPPGPEYTQQPMEITQQAQESTQRAQELIQQHMETTEPPQPTSNKGIFQISLASYVTVAPHSHKDTFAQKLQGADSLPNNYSVPFQETRSWDQWKFLQATNQKLRKGIPSTLQLSPTPNQSKEDTVQSLYKTYQQESPLTTLEGPDLTTSLTLVKGNQQTSPNKMAGGLLRYHILLQNDSTTTKMQQVLSMTKLNSSEDTQAKEIYFAKPNIEDKKSNEDELNDPAEIEREQVIFEFPSFVGRLNNQKISNETNTSKSSIKLGEEDELNPNPQGKVILDLEEGNPDVLKHPILEGTVRFSELDDPDLILPGDKQGTVVIMEDISLPNKRFARGRSKNRTKSDDIERTHSKKREQLQQKLEKKTHRNKSTRVTCRTMGQVCLYILNPRKVVTTEDCTRTLRRLRIQNLNTTIQYCQGIYKGQEKNYGRHKEKIKDIQEKHRKVSKDMDSDPNVEKSGFNSLPFNRATLVQRDSMSPLHTAQVLQRIGERRMGGITQENFRSRPRLPLLGGYLRYRLLPRWYKQLQTRRQSLAVVPQVGSRQLPIKMDFMKFRNMQRRLRHHSRFRKPLQIQSFAALGHTIEEEDQTMSTDYAPILITDIQQHIKDFNLTQNTAGKSIDEMKGLLIFRKAVYNQTKLI